MVLDPITLGLIKAGVIATGAIGGGHLAGRGAEKSAKRTAKAQNKDTKRLIKFSKEQAKEANKETHLGRTKRHLTDELLRSVQGRGRYSDLFNPNLENAELFDPSSEAFQKSFVNPATSLFKNKIAPEIQQQYIASGQHRGTGLEDQLLRAGVDLDSKLNDKFMEFQQGAYNRRHNAVESAQTRHQNAIDTILGMQPGNRAMPQNMPMNNPYSPSSGDTFKSSVSGYFSSPAFADTTADIFKEMSKAKTTAPSTAPNSYAPRKGFQPPDWGFADPRWQGGY